MKLHKALICLAGLGTFVLSQASGAVAISGNPLADSWTSHDNSLSKGVYAKSGGDANYGYDTYGASFYVSSAIGSGTYAWSLNDTVVGVGGVFNAITAAEAGWESGTSFTGDSVNERLPHGKNNHAPKLQVKFGTQDASASWSASTTAPSNGNGNSSSSNGGGRVQVRTSAYFSDSYWQQNSNKLLVPRKNNPDFDNLHVLWDVDGTDLNPFSAARMIWNWDDDTDQLQGWELLLNVSLLERLAPDDFNGFFPEPGDPAILTVQDGDHGYYTDSLIDTGMTTGDGEGGSDPVVFNFGDLPTINNVPAPGALWLFAGGLLGLLAASRRRLTR